jgi:hypothetical protein
MKTLLFLLVFFPAMLGGNQNSCEIRRDLFEGYIFDKDYQLVFMFHDQKSRIDLDDNDIVKAEQILKTKIKIINRFKPNQFSGLPVVDEKLEQYRRQYVGYTNSKDQKIVWINLVWNTMYGDDLPVNIIRKFDGCSYLWNIKVNLTTKELFDLDVNFCQ